MEETKKYYVEENKTVNNKCISSCHLQSIHHALQ